MEGGVDRISNLPDDILVKIMSPLSAKTILSRFCLKYTYDGEHCLHISQWINFVFRRGVQELELDFINSHCYYEMPIGFFNYEGMTIFKLSLCLLKRSNSFKIYSMLKSLHLNAMKLTSDLLNEVIKIAFFWKIFILRNVISLSIQDCKILERGLITNTPRLQFFEYFGRLIPFYMEMMPFVQHVELDFEHELVLVNASEELDKRLYLPITLIFLKHLTIKADLHRELPSIEFLLKISPNLETLSIEMVTCFSQNYWETKRLEFGCFAHNFKTMKINDFNRWKNKLQFIQYVLKNALVLEKLIINITRKGVSDEYHSTLLVTAQEIRDYPRASLHAKVLIQ
ncbi:hypothetical protein NE237_033151 [Protea cynaroides]|uniref:FBD domain-containing protein n=1 Tax=Protea cynaroides TaxID=273540 RepID=A0A9Q0L604_9MAGN|nr:hypothetical protein NE237_033151 [Protea cynaroides]